MSPCLAPQATSPRLASIVHLLLGFWLAVVACGLAAQPRDVDATLDTTRQQIEATRKSIAAKPAGVDLPQARAAALAAQARALDIADELAPQLAGLESRLSELGAAQANIPEDRDLAERRAQLTKSRSTLDAQIKMARLLAVEGEQLAGEVATLRRAQFHARLGERVDLVTSARFWSELGQDLPRDSARLRSLGTEFAAALAAPPPGAWTGLLLALASVWGLLWWGRGRVLAWIREAAPGGRLRRSLRAVTVVVSWTLATGALATTLSLTLNWNEDLSGPAAALLGDVVGIVWFTGYLGGLAAALLCARHPTWRLPAVPDIVASTLRWFPLQIALISSLTWLAERLALTIRTSLSITVAVNAAVALALAFTVGLAMLRAERAWRGELVSDLGAVRPAWRVALAAGSWLVLCGVLTILLSGYIAFGSFAIKQLIWAAIVLASAYLLAAVLDDVLMAWSGSFGAADDAASTAAAPAVAPGAKKPSAPVRKALVQAAVLASGLLRVVVALLALMLLVAPFGEGPSDLLRRSGEWREGFAIGEVRLQPTALLQALLVLAAGLVIVRLLRGWLGDRYLPTTGLDGGMRNSATTLFGYAGVVVVVALALSALGLGLERVAWVASALSVGIGFGLQAVVQNFVSGLILLAERPVKVGDWVSLGGIEGDIRRINVRATEIQMGDRSTVIVPNSEFITKVVRNVTLSDPIGLVQLKLPVPLGSDPQQVRELMLAAFRAEPAVLDEPAPGVMLDGVEAGNLLFNATGFVASPRLAGGVRSTLLFDVLARLQAAGIVLARPPTMLLRDAAESPSPGAAPPPAGTSVDAPVGPPLA